MSLHTNPSPMIDPGSKAIITWSSPDREAAFNGWFAAATPAHQLVPATLRLASADASFRRYLRVDQALGSCIIMDAPPDKEDCAPFAKVAALMMAAGLNVPRVLAWEPAQGFMLLSDLGHQTMMQVINREDPAANHGLYLQALDALVAWQLASRPDVLPPSMKR